MCLRLCSCRLTMFCNRFTKCYQRLAPKQCFLLMANFKHFNNRMAKISQLPISTKSKLFRLHFTLHFVQWPMCFTSEFMCIIFTANINVSVMSSKLFALVRPMSFSSLFPDIKSIMFSMSIRLLLLFRTLSL